MDADQIIVLREGEVRRLCLGGGRRGAVWWVLDDAGRRRAHAPRTLGPAHLALPPSLPQPAHRSWSAAGTVSCWRWGVCTQSCGTASGRRPPRRAPPAPASPRSPRSRSCRARRSELRRAALRAPNCCCDPSPSLSAAHTSRFHPTLLSYSLPSYCQVHPSASRDLRQGSAGRPGQRSGCSGRRACCALRGEEGG